MRTLLSLPLVLNLLTQLLEEDITALEEKQERTASERKGRRSMAQCWLRQT